MRPLQFLCFCDRPWVEGQWLQPAQNSTAVRPFYFVAWLTVNALLVAVKLAPANHLRAFVGEQKASAGTTMRACASGRWDFDLGEDTRLVFIRQDNLNKMLAGFIPFLGRAASPGDIVVVNSGLHHNNDYAGACVGELSRLTPVVDDMRPCGRQSLRVFMFY